MSVRTQDGKLDVELVSTHDALTVVPSESVPELAVVPESLPHDTSVAKSANVATNEKNFFTYNLHVKDNSFSLNSSLL